MPKNKRKNKKKGGGLLFGVVAFVAIAAALAFAVTVFFRVSAIDVEGESSYSQDEIISASGIGEGDSLIFMSCSGAAAKIRQELIYIGEVAVERVLPNKVVIRVEESGNAAVVETESGLWLVDKSGRLLSQATTGDAEKHIKVIGFSALSPETGEQITVADEDSAKVSYLVGILSALYSQDMENDVSSVDVSNSANAQFKYLGRFSVKLGANENLEYKLGLLKNAAAELSDTDTGTFDLSEDKKAYFSPD